MALIMAKHVLVSFAQRRAPNALARCAVRPRTPGVLVAVAVLLDNRTAASDSNTRVNRQRLLTVEHARAHELLLLRAQGAEGGS